MEKKEEKEIKNARGWMSLERGKETEQSRGRGEEEGRGRERINIHRCWGSSGRHELIPQRLGGVALGSGLEMRSRSPVASLF